MCGGLNRNLWVILSLIGVASVVLWALFPGTVNAFDNSAFMQSYFGKLLFLLLILFWVVCIGSAFISAGAAILLLIKGARKGSVMTSKGTDSD